MLDTGLYKFIIIIIIIIIFTKYETCFVLNLVDIQCQQSSSLNKFVTKFEDIFEFLKMATMNIEDASWRVLELGKDLDSHLLIMKLLMSRSHRQTGNEHRSTIQVKKDRLSPGPISAEDHLVGANAPSSFSYEIQFAQHWLLHWNIRLCNRWYIVLFAVPKHCRRRVAAGVQRRRQRRRWWTQHSLALMFESNSKYRNEK